MKEEIKERLEEVRKCIHKWLKKDGMPTQALGSIQEIQMAQDKVSPPDSTQEKETKESLETLSKVAESLMKENETVQEESPWYHGNQLSAWQFDDMSSALFCSLVHLPKGHEIDFGSAVTAEDKLMNLWQEQGEVLIRLKVREVESWQMLQDSKQSEYMNLVKKMKSNWRRTSFERK